MSTTTARPTHRFHGGVHFAAPPASADSAKIWEAERPREVVLPLTSARGALRCVVQPGQRLRQGERVGEPIDALGVAVHASVAGVVSAIETRELPPTGERCPCVIVAADSDDDIATLPPLGWREAPRETLLARLAAAGVAGLGGAGFPTARKLSLPVHTLILNGAECEPYIGCDEALLRAHADEVLDGALVLQRACGAARVIVGIEERRAEACTALLAAAAARAPEVEVVRVPTVYPVGGERQLIRVLTGHEVPSDGLPQDIGIVCQNVATAQAAWRAVAHGEALTARLVSVAGRGVRSPRTLRVRLGTSIAEVIAQAGGYTEAAARLVMGGPMMGVALAHDAMPVLKTTNCILVLAQDEVLARAPERPCIRCGDCADACPAQLLPQTLLAQLRADELGAAQRQGLADCIECGACAYVCPSQIPLVDWYRHGKSVLAAQAAERARIDRARERHEARQARLARDAAERVARVAARAQDAGDAAAQSPDSAQAAAPVPEPASPAAPMDKSAVLAAIARAKAKKAGAPKPDDPAP